MRLQDDWNRFWFAPQTGHVLGLYRIAIGLLTLYSFSLFAKDADVFFSDEGVLTTRTVARELGREYHTILHWIRSPFGVRLALAALMLAAVCFTVGFHTRVASVLLYLLVVSFHERNPLVLNGSDSVLRTMLFFFMFAPAGAAWSVDHVRRRIRSREVTPRLISPWAQRMMQVQVSVIYFVTAYAKTRGALYHQGTAMYYVFGLVDFNVRGVEQLMNHPLIYSFLTYAVLFIEVSLPFLLWFRASRPYAVGMGLLAHGWIMVFMTIPVFGILMVATYIPFFTEEECEGALQRARDRLAGRRAILFYDEACARCRKVRGLVESLDLLGRVELKEAGSVALDRLPPGRPRAFPLEEGILVLPSGGVLGGFDACRWLAGRLPAIAWTLPLWYVPGVAFWGRKICRKLARGHSRSAPSRATLGPVGGAATEP